MMCNNCGKWAGAYAGFAKDHNLCNCVQHAPVKKEWIGLTDDDVDYAVDAVFKGFNMKPRNNMEIEYLERVIKFVEAKLKEKNT